MDMDEIRFHAIVGEGRVIHLPEGLNLPPGEIEVIVRPGRPLASDEAPADPLAPTRDWMLAFAAEAEGTLAALDLPVDLAENHDHYAHGRPRS
jgi:hypothetical protein